jgi:hypothetical protein
MNGVESSSCATRDLVSSKGDINSLKALKASDYHMLHLLENTIIPHSANKRVKKKVKLSS